MASSDAPSLSFATLGDKAVLVGFGTHFLLSRFPLTSGTADAHEAADDFDDSCATIVDDGQMVRAVAFLRIPDGPMCAVAAGDGKYINVYNIASRREDNPDAVGDVSSDEEGSDRGGTQAILRLQTKKWQPAYRHGPHTKRITHLAACDEGSIIFADKFGEVYRLRLGWSPGHTIEVDGDATAPTTMLLQHFSMITCLFLSAPVPRREPVASTEERRAVPCRRLITCDKEGHARVSRYPETYLIEDYLWPRCGTEGGAAASTATVTCVAEIPSLDEMESTMATQDTRIKGEVVEVNKRNRLHNAPYNYYATGHLDGGVQVWAARNDIPASSSDPFFHFVATIAPPSTVAGSVVGLCYVQSSHDPDGRPLHPQDTPCGLFIAYEHCTDIIYIPLLRLCGKYGLHVVTAGRSTASMMERPVAVLRGGSGASVVVFLRSGALSVLRLDTLPSAATDKAERLHGDDGSHKRAVVTCLPEPANLRRLQESLASVLLQHTGDAPARTVLAELDLFGQWRHDVVDPRTRKTRRHEEETNVGMPSASADDSCTEDNERVLIQADVNPSTSSRKHVRS